MQMPSSPVATATDAARDPGLEAATRLAGVVRDQVQQVLRGKPEPVELALVALLSGGHLLVEDVPGVGKTLLAKALARSVGGVFRRVQCTPDLLPSELTGVSVFHLAGNEWEFRPGPLFAHVVLVDELNRATPRTQSALLEAMEERQVTVDGVTHALPQPFFLVATQNPYETTGTFPLVEGQLDRFSVVTHIGPPDPATERQLLLGEGGEDALGRSRVGLRSDRARGRDQHGATDPLRAERRRLRDRARQRDAPASRGRDRRQPARQPRARARRAGARAARRAAATWSRTT